MYFLNCMLSSFWCYVMLCCLCRCFFLSTFVLGCTSAYFSAVLIKTVDSVSNRMKFLFTETSNVLFRPLEKRTPGTWSFFSRFSFALLACLACEAALLFPVWTPTKVSPFLSSRIILAVSGPDFRSYNLDHFFLQIFFFNHIGGYHSGSLLSGSVGSPFACGQK